VAPSAEAEYCKDRTDDSTGENLIIAQNNNGCKYYNEDIKKCKKRYENPANNNPQAYGTGHECAWNSSADSDNRCKNNGSSCQVASSPTIASMMDSDQYCIGASNGSYTVNEGTKDCKKFNQGNTDYAKSKCEKRFHYVSGNKSGQGVTKLCMWHSGECRNDGKACLRAVAPNGEAAPTNGD